MRILQADCFLQLGDPDSSFAALNILDQELLNSRPDLLIAQAKICHALGKAGQCRSAMEAARQKLEAEPATPEEDSEHYHQLGLLFASLEDFSAAKDSFLQALARNPDKLWSQYEAATKCLVLGQIEEGRLLLSQALDNPKTGQLETRLIAKDLADRYFFKLEETEEYQGVLKQHATKLEQDKRSAYRQNCNIKQLQKMICRAVTSKLEQFARETSLRVGVFAAGEHTRMLLEETSLKRVGPIALFDNNSEKWNQAFCGLKISSPDLINQFNLDLLIISSYAAEDDIFRQIGPTVHPRTKILRVYKEFEAIDDSAAVDYAKFFKSSYSESLEQLQNFYRQAQLINYPCPLCEADDFEPLTEHDRHDLGLKTVLCLHCGMLLQSPRPKAKWYQTFYADFFWKAYVGHKYLDFEDMFTCDCQEEKARFILECSLSNLPPTGSYLDIGCGLGAMLKVFRQRYPQWNYLGLEPGPSSAGFARNHLDLEVQEGYLTEETLNSLPDNWNLISAIHVLEHLENPLQVLRHLRDLLADDGVMYLEVPDFFSAHWHGKWRL